MAAKWKQKQEWISAVESLVGQIADNTFEAFQAEASGPVSDKDREAREQRAFELYKKLYPLLQTHMPLSYMRMDAQKKPRKRQRQLSAEQLTALEDHKKSFKTNLLDYLEAFADSMAPLYSPAHVRQIHYAFYNIAVSEKKMLRALGLRHVDGPFVTVSS